MSPDSPSSPAPAPASPVWDGARRRLPFIVGMAVALAIVVAAFAYRASGRESTDDAQVEGHITPVGTRVGGAVLEVLIRDNQQVKAGDVLVRIDPRDYEVALAKARAQLADAEAALAQASTGLPIVSTTSASDVERAAGSTESATAASAAAASDVEAAHARLEAARARLVEAEANADRARKDRDRLRGLVEKEEISQQQYDTAAAAATVTEAAVATARAVIAEAETGVRVAQSRVAQSQGARRQAQAVEHATRTAPDQVRAAKARFDAAQAKVDSERASVHEAELRLGYTTIKAPADGVVSRKSVEPGQIVQPGQPLMALVSLDGVWVVANFKETQLDSIRPGQRVVIDVDAYGHEVEGSVESISPATGAKFSLLPAENASGNFVKVVQRVPVRIAISPGGDPQHQLRPGMSVEPTVYTR